MSVPIPCNLVPKSVYLEKWYTNPTCSRDFCFFILTGHAKVWSPTEISETETKEQGRENQRKPNGKAS